MNRSLASALFVSLLAASPVLSLDKEFTDQYRPVTEYGRKKTQTTPSPGTAYGTSSYNENSRIKDRDQYLSLDNLNRNVDPMVLKFQYTPGEKYKVSSVVVEDVYINSRKSHTAEIVNRVTASIDEVYEDGSALHNGLFVTTTEGVLSGNHRLFNWDEEYESVFRRDTTGKYDISSKYFMPTVRDVPVFPDYAVKPGDTWTKEGHEAHDLRHDWGIQEPMKVPFIANYEFLGMQDNLCVIQVSYTSMTQLPRTKDWDGISDIPVSYLGFSSEIIWWNNEVGEIDHYRENFRMLMDTYMGNTIEFRGYAHAELSDLEMTGTQDNVDKVQDTINRLGYNNVYVTAGDKGLTISLTDIKFEPDSSELMQSEKEKLFEIAKILKTFPNNDILVTGHTALAGTEAVRQSLSEERAQAVADYLIFVGVKDQYHIFTRGMGANQPIADNRTPEGKAQNRRVEITILDK